MQPRKSHPKNLKRCSHEVELKLAQGWRGADPSRTIAACTVPTPDPPGAQSPPHGRRRHPLPQVHAGATSTFPGSQRQGAARYRLTLTRLERTAECSGARRGGELQSPNHEQGALAGCPGSGPGGAESTSPATRPTSRPLWEIPRGAARARNHRREQRGPRGAAQLLAARPEPSTGVKRSGEWQRLICVQKREIFRSVARYD